MLTHPITLFFYDNFEHLLTDYLDDHKFRYEGIKIKNSLIGLSFLNILSNYNTILSILKNTLNSIKKLTLGDNTDKNLYDIVLYTQGDLIKISSLFEIFSFEKEWLEFLNHDKAIWRKTLDNKKNSINFIEDYIDKIVLTKKWIDIYYNINNNKTLECLSPNKRIFYSNAIQIELSKASFMPLAKQFYCIKYDDYLLPAESLLYNTYFNIITVDELKVGYNNNSENNKLLKYILDHEIFDVSVYQLHSFWDFLNVYYNYLIQNKFTINKCKNCGKYFIPINKNNETLCDNIFKNRKNL